MMHRIEQGEQVNTFIIALILTLCMMLALSCRDTNEDGFTRYTIKEGHHYASGVKGAISDIDITNAFFLM